MLRKFIWTVALLSVGCGVAAESDVEARLKRFEQELAMLRDASARKDHELAILRAKVAKLEGNTVMAKSDRLVQAEHVDVHAAHEGGHGEHSVLSAGGVKLNAAAVLSVTAGGSSEDNAGIESLQGGGHDPQSRGFTLNQLELSLEGEVDGFGSFETHAVILEEEIELEEAFVTSDFLPADLELKAGYFLTEFGYQNKRHAHDWDWIDQPVSHSRILGGEGQRGVGLQLSRRLPTPWHSELLASVQQAGSSTMTSFGGGGHAHGEEEEEEELPFEEGVGGRPQSGFEVGNLGDAVYALRLANTIAVRDDLSLLLGTSWMNGPNNSGQGERTNVYGADFRFAFHPDGCAQHEPTLVWQTEFVKRDYDAAGVTVEDGDPLDPSDDFVFAADTLDDWGIYSQATYRATERWSLGVRGEYASGSGVSYEEGIAIARADDPSRNNRLRISPLLIFRPAKGTRIRLQYNYDDADHLEDGDAHSLWLGLEWLMGSHADHQH